MKSIPPTLNGASVTSRTTSPRIQRNRRWILIAVAFILVVSAGALWAHNKYFRATDTCEQQAGITVICGFNNPEDLAQIGATPWVLASNLGDKDWQEGGMSAYNTVTGSVVDVPINFSTPAQSAYSTCPGAPDVTLFSAHGLSLQDRDGTMTLLAVNHGGRESIEAFDIDMTGNTPGLTWKGCAIYPEGKVGNSVAAYGENQFLATVPQDAGLSTGGVYAWAPDTGWNRRDDLEFAGNNGILVSPDEQWVYIAEWSGKKVVRAALDEGPAAMESVDLEFLPDNIRFAPDGSILVTGQDTSQIVIAGVCNMTSIDVCPATSVVAELDASTLVATTQVELPPTKTFGGATSAVVVGDALLVSSFRSPSILSIPVKQLPLIRD